MSDFDLESAFVPSLFKPSGLLPIAKHREELLYAIETFPVTVLVGQTGSGKTTQLPQFLEQAGWCTNGKVIAITQPRRVAATSVAIRVAEEMRCTVGQEVGYSIRFEDVTSAKTRIKFLTDGLLLREALVDPLLSRYSVIMVDEAHERSLSSDLLLGILKKIRRKRPELRIVVSSATLDAESFLRFFSTSDDASNIDPAIGTVFHLGGRMYPVDVHYLAEPAENYIEKAIQTVFDIHTQESDGDILLFLTGREEIDTVMQEIADRLLDMQPQASRLLAVPLYAGLPTDQQMAVFEPSPTNTRKVVVATNIAEASVTISGIAYVIDCGFVKLRAYDPRTGIDTLTATPISRASATQRSGRAGRTKPGKCYRLYTEAAFSNLTATTIPEMQRSNLAPVILQLKALGIDNIARFDFPTAPPSELIIRALELLHALGALDSYAKLTRPLGTRMCDLALEPQMAKALLSAPTFSCLPELLSIAALTSLQSSIFITHDSSTSRPRFAATEGDALTMLNAFAASSAHNHATAWCHAHSLNAPLLRRAASIRAQLQRSLERAGVSVPATSPADGVAERIRRCLTAGFFAHAARMASDGSFRTVDGGVQMFVHPSSVLFNRKAEWVIFHEVVQTAKKTFIRDVTCIEKAWLLEYAPEYYRVKGV